VILATLEHLKKDTPSIAATKNLGLYATEEQLLSVSLKVFRRTLQILLSSTSFHYKQHEWMIKLNSQEYSITNIKPSLFGLHSAVNYSPIIITALLPLSGHLLAQTIGALLHISSEKSRYRNSKELVRESLACLIHVALHSYVCGYVNDLKAFFPGICSALFTICSAKQRV